MTRPQAVDQFDFHHVLAGSAGISLVLFATAGCGACKRLLRVLDEHAELFADVNVFEVDAERDLALTREFDVFHLPAMFLYVDGEYHCAMHAEATPAKLRDAIDVAVMEPAEEAP